MVKTAVYILTRSSKKSVDGKIPYEAWRKKKPNVHHLRMLGFVAHVKNLGPGMNKLSRRSTPGVFVRYDTGTKAYWVYDLVRECLLVTRDVIFNERRAWDWAAHCSAATTIMPATFTVIYSKETSATISSPELAVHDAEPQTPVASMPEFEPRTLAHKATQAQYVTPPTHNDARDTDSQPRNYRQLTNFYNMPKADEVEESGLCFLDD